MTARELLRSAEIAAAAAQVGVLILARRGDRRSAAIGESVSVFCVRLGPTFVKLGQLLSTRVDLLPREAILALERLQNRLPPMSFFEARAALERELCSPLDDVFASVDPTPVASGSIACVYRAELHDGRRVALKVQRPGLAKLLLLDVKILRCGARLLGRLPMLKNVPLEEGFEEISDTLIQQIDFERERENLDRLAEALRDLPSVRLPRPVPELCSRHLLVLEFLDVEKSIFIANRVNGELNAALGAALDALYTMIFQAGLVHCDLHPGNLFLSASGEVVILDTGFVAVIPPDTRRSFAAFFYGMATNNGPLCADLALDLASRVPVGLSKPDFEAAISRIVADAAGMPVSEFSIGRFVAQLFRAQASFGVRSSSAFTSAILALLVFEGVARQVNGELDFQTAAKPHIARALFS